MKVTYQVCVDAKIEEVAPYVLTYSDKALSLNPSIVERKSLEGDPDMPMSGSSMLLKVKYHKKIHEHKVEIVDYKPNSYIQIKEIDSQFVTVIKAEFSENNNKTIITYKWDIAAKKWFIKYISLLLLPTLKNSIWAYNKSLRSQFASDTNDFQEPIQITLGGVPANLIIYLAWIGIVTMSGCFFRYSETKAWKPAVFPGQSK